MDNRDVFAREPFSARFETNDGFQFVMATVHPIYGKSVAEREKEAHALRSYLDWLNDSFEGSPSFLTGNFNLPPTNPAWGPVGQTAAQLITGGGTTLSTKDGRFANLYDDIRAPPGVSLPIHASGRLEFPHKVLGITHAEARDSVSDHIPVWLSPDAEPVNFPATDPSKFDRAAFLSGEDHRPEGEQAPVIGNKNSKIYHLPHCPGYSKTGVNNRQPFETEAAARQAGFRMARNC
ncbi:hypothetical protein [Sulfitobacter sp. DSM 110093]|uniref:sunset domain-containing protein n=1 Tax=Sulfitobacter sp. DSM 110093 TaxID=2883127 RepID=UPI001FAB9F9A|nr:hypothetical protein [Sulfitobacter sp. DSM 110093]